LNGKEGKRHASVLGSGAAMALRQFASQAVTALRVRSTPLVSSRSFLLPLAQRLYSTENFKYLKSHEWVNVDGEVGTVGISDFAQSELGEVVFVDLPEVGSALEKGGQLGVVESVKAASDVYSPVSGTVVEANAELSTNPGLINSGAQGEGWMVKVKLEKPEELSELLDASAYEAHVSSLEH